MKKVFLITLSILLCCLAIFSTTANAAIVTIQTIAPGEAWYGNWSSQVGFGTVSLSVDKTAFYDFTVTDYNQTGIFSFSIVDNSTDEYVESASSQTVKESHTLSKILLLKDHEYELECYYYDYETYNDLDANLSIVFNENNEEICEIPNCNLNSSKLMAQFTDDDYKLWLRFKTSGEGDYSLNFGDLHAYISVYDALTGERIHSSYDTEYYDIFDWYCRDRLVFHLAKGTEYYIEINSYVNSSTKLSMTKNDKTVKHIAANKPLYDISGFSEIDDSVFDYKVTYTDNSTEIVGDSATIYRNGYECPYVEYVGHTVYINDELYLGAGKQPVESTYNGVTTTIYVDVESFPKYFSYLRATDEYDECDITYEDDELQSYWWYIRVSQSGIYDIWRYNSDDFNTNFLYYSIEIVDDTNNVVEYNDGWALIANKEYALNFEYRYDPEYSYNDITFWLQKEKDLPADPNLNGWQSENGKWYFYENGAKLKNCWKKDSKGWVYLGADGAMLTNAWCTDSKGWCYVGADGYAMTNCWAKDSKGWIWLDKNGSMTKNTWIKDGGKWYFLDENGYMACNQWRKDSKGWCYLTASGAMATNQWVKDSKGWCYIGADGYCWTNCWAKDSVGWIWLDSEGSMTKNAWVKDGSSWYYLDGNGYMVANRSLQLGGKTYSFNASGVCTNP